jgi:hypothetical protein
LYLLDPRFSVVVRALQFLSRFCSDSLEMKHNHKIGGHRPFFAVEQPYFLKHSPGNPFLGAVYDGTSTEYGKGFALKPIHWLYRFRYNTSPRGSVPLNLKNPGGKNVHWLEVSNVKKFAVQIFSDEGLPHTFLATCLFTLVAWQLLRYAFMHPDLTLNNMAFYTTKPHVAQLRSNDLHPMDKPAFKWFQRTSEFYAYDTYRDFIEMGIIANDPYVEFIKSVGREKDLVAKPMDPNYNAPLIKLLPHTRVGELPARDPLAKKVESHGHH